MQTAVLPKVQRIDLRKLPVLAKEQISKVELPERYKAARKALQECWRIDELKDISDKHAAIAHYAKQAKDESLLYYAKRIQLRAFERMGELLHEIENYDERCAVAEQAGTSRTQANRAYRTAWIPKKVRDQLIEATPPPSTIALSQHGEGYQPKAGHRASRFHYYAEREEKVKHTPKGCSERLLSEFDYFKAALNESLDDNVGGRFTMADLARAVDPGDVEFVRERLIPIMEMLDEFDQYLPKPPE